MKLADGREFVTTEAIEGVKYNVYGCPGTPENATRVEHGEGGGRVIPGKVAHYLLSMDVDEGVTPFMVICPDHGLAAESAFYPAGIVMRPSLWPVRMIWRKPTKGELNAGIALAFGAQAKSRPSKSEIGAIELAADSLGPEAFRAAWEQMVAGEEGAS